MSVPRVRVEKAPSGRWRAIGTLGSGVAVTERDTCQQAIDALPELHAMLTGDMRTIHGLATNGPTGRVTCGES